MKLIKKIVEVVTIMAVTIANTLPSSAENPVVQNIYTCDPAPMVYNDTCYLYTGHDEDGSTWFTMNEWRCYSSTDMKNWTDLGAPLAYTDFSWSTGDAWAGQCVERNGKFYFYVPLTPTEGGNAIGVAVADNPEGPFVDAIGKPLITGGWGHIDPTVFVDDDGQAYMYWGNPFLKYVKLNEDMISYSGKIEDVELTAEGFGERIGDEKRATLYEEGPWFYKRNGLYYMVYAASGIPENICYSTSDNPTGPWTFKGVIMPTQGGSFTNHPGIADYKGNSYFFYHNGALPGGGGFTRSVCIEQFEYNEDGSFPTINMTLEGPAQIGSLNPYQRTEAETICFAKGIETEKCSLGGMNVCNIKNDDYIKVKGVDFGSGAESFEAMIASGSDGGSIELRLDSPDGNIIGTCSFSGTQGWQEWEKKTCDISGAEGKHDLYLVFKGEDGILFNFDWWRFLTPEMVTFESSVQYEDSEVSNDIASVTTADETTITETDNTDTTTENDVTTGENAIEANANKNVLENSDDSENFDDSSGFDWTKIFIAAGIVPIMLVAVLAYRKIKKK